jgi:hypothetical protein
MNSSRVCDCPTCHGTVLLKRSQWYAHRKRYDDRHEEVKDSLVSAAAGSAAAAAVDYTGRIDTVTTAEEPGPEYEIDDEFVSDSTSGDESSDSFESDSEGEGRDGSIEDDEGDRGGGCGNSESTSSFDPFSTPWLGLEKGDFISVMDGVDVPMALQRRHKLTKAAMRDIFDAVKALTVGCNLCSYDDAVRFTKQYGITQTATNIDACVNDCCLFRGAIQDSEVCPHCNESRFDADNTSRKVFRYFPLSATLRQQFLDSAFANKVRLQKDVSKLLPSDLHGSQGWKEKVLGDTEFMKECRNLVFSFCADGVNPFGKSCQYGMWPLMLRNENVNAEIRYRYDNFLL